MKKTLKLERVVERGQAGEVTEAEDPCVVLLIAPVAGIDQRRFSGAWVQPLVEAQALALIPCRTRHGSAF